MTVLYLLLAVFALLTIYFIYGDYKKGTFSKKAFILVVVLETVVAIVSILLFIFSL